MILNALAWLIGVRVIEKTDAYLIFRLPNYLRRREVLYEIQHRLPGHYIETRDGARFVRIRKPNATTPA